MQISKTILFDINETILDLSVLGNHFKRIFGNSFIYKEWFNQCIQNAMLSVILKKKISFKEVGIGSLIMVGQKYDVVIKDNDKELILKNLIDLPVHDDVIPSFEMLKNNGFNLVALSNNAHDTLVIQLKNAKIYHYFDSILSVEIAETLKPSAQVYQKAAQHLKENKEDLTMVACHEWDIAAAMHVGYKGALLTRKGFTSNPIFKCPNIIANNLNDIALRLVKEIK